MKITFVGSFLSFTQMLFYLSLNPNQSLINHLNVHIYLIYVCLFYLSVCMRLLLCLDVCRPICFAVCQRVRLLNMRGRVTVEGVGGGGGIAYASSLSVTRTMVYVRQNKTGIPETVHEVTHTNQSNSHAVIDAFKTPTSMSSFLPSL